MNGFVNECIHVLNFPILYNKHVCSLQLCVIGTSLIKDASIGVFTNTLKCSFSSVAAAVSPPRIHTVEQ